MKKFIIFRIDRLGDFLIITNIIKSIKKKFKDSHITVVCSPLNAKLVKSYSIIDNIIVYKRNNSLIQKLKILRKICRSSYFASLSLDGKTFSNLSNLFLKANYKFGISYKFNVFKDLSFFYWSKPNFFYNYFVLDDFSYFTSKKTLKKVEHLPSILLNIVKKLKLNISIKSPYYYEVKDEINLKFTKIFKKKIKQKFILIHLDEKWNDIKNIENDFYLEILKFQKKIKNKIVISAFKNKCAYFKNLKKNLQNKNILIYENLDFRLFERFVAKSFFSMSCHSGYLVQVAGSNRTKIIDIINRRDLMWYSCWKPKNTKHSFIFKSNNDNRYSIGKIFKKIKNQ